MEETQIQTSNDIILLGSILESWLVAGLFHVDLPILQIGVSKDLARLIATVLKLC